MGEGGADDGVAARAARAHLTRHPVHPAVPRAGPALLQLAPRLLASVRYSQAYSTTEGIFAVNCQTVKPNDNQTRYYNLLYVLFFAQMCLRWPMASYIPGFENMFMCCLGFVNIILGALATLLLI